MKKIRPSILYAFAVALGLGIGTMLFGCAGLPIRVDDADDVRAVVSAAEILVTNVAPLCEAASPLPREHPCLLLPTVTTGLDRVHAALDDGNVAAAIDAWHRVAPAVEALAEVLR